MDCVITLRVVVLSIWTLGVSRDNDTGTDTDISIQTSRSFVTVIASSSSNGSSSTSAISISDDLSGLLVCVVRKQAAPCWQRRHSRVELKVTHRVTPDPWS